MVTSKRYGFGGLLRVFNGSTLTTFPQSTLSSVITESITKGGPIKDFRLKIRRGEFAGSSLHVSTRNIIASPFYVKGYFGSHNQNPTLNNTWRDFRGTIDVNPSINFSGVPSSTKADTAALTVLAKKLNSELTTFQGGVFVGELRETIHLIRHPLQAFRQGISRHLDLVAKRARRIRRLSNMKDMVANTYLEFVFGARPLLADIDDGAEALANFVTDPTNQEFKTLVANGVDEVAGDKSNVPILSEGVWFLLRANFTRRKRESVRYLVCIGVEPSVRSCALAKFGINVANFVPTLWELIPYSFVVDYFTNVGDVLSGLANLTANVRWTMRWAVSEDIIESCKGFYFAPPSDPLNPSSQVCSGGYLRDHTRSILRDPYIGSLVPPFRWELPGEGSMKWMNLAALGAQLVGTRRIVQQPVRNKLHLLRKGTF